MDLLARCRPKWRGVYRCWAESKRKFSTSLWWQSHGPLDPAPKSILEALLLLLWFIATLKLIVGQTPRLCNLPKHSDDMLEACRTVMRHTSVTTEIAASVDVCILTERASAQSISARTAALAPHGFNMKTCGFTVQSDKVDASLSALQEFLGCHNLTKQPYAHDTWPILASATVQIYYHQWACDMCNLTTPEMPISIGRVFSYHDARRVIFPYFSRAFLSVPKTSDQGPKISYLLTNLTCHHKFSFTAA